MRVGISAWGITNTFHEHRYATLDTPDGHRYGRPILIRELLNRGHDVVMMQQRRDGSYLRPAPLGVGSFTYAEEDPSFPDLDVLFLEFRWSTWKNDRRHPDHKPDRYEPDLDRQLECIEYYRDRCSILAWDTDLKVTLDDERAFPELILLDPALRPRRLSRDRVSLPFWTDWKELLPVREPEPTYGYVGNNYSRDDQFQKYYFTSPVTLRKQGIQTKMYGNWLQRSPERADPSTLIKCNECVGFEHRMNFHDSMARMNAFICTTHVSKPLYYETGFVSPRYMEALAVGCPALVPQEMADSIGAILGHRWVVSGAPNILGSVLDIARLPLSARVELVQEQRHNLMQLGMFGVDRAVALIENGGRV